MLRDDVEQYTNLTGEDGWSVPIMKVGAYLDGYNKGLDVLDKIKAEIERIELLASYTRGDIKQIALDIIDKYNAESEEQNMSDIELIRDFRNKINAYHKDYKFSKEEILNILERYELKYNKAVIKQKNENKK